MATEPQETPSLIGYAVPPCGHGGCRAPAAMGRTATDHPGRAAHRGAPCRPPTLSFGETTVPGVTTAAYDGGARFLDRGGAHRWPGRRTTGTHWPTTPGSRSDSTTPTLRTPTSSSCGGSTWLTAVCYACPAV